MNHPKAIYLIIISTIALTSCRFPDDPNHTLATIRETHEMKVGICSTTSKEKEILKNLAKKLQANIRWTNGNQEELYRMLRDYKLDIVSCSIHEDSPWKEKIAFTAPFYTDPSQSNDNPLVMAVPNGENAWLVYVNEFIQEQKIRD